MHYDIIIHHIADFRKEDEFQMDGMMNFLGLMDKKPMILAIDDMETNLMLLEEMLQEDFDVHCESSGKTALAWLKENHCDLVLLDYHMPEMDGMEVLEHMKESESLHNVPVIFLTADMTLESYGFEAGAVDFILKPFMPDVVRLRVKRILNYEYLQAHLADEVNKQTKLAESRRASLQRIFEQTVFALAQAIDAKDKYTHGHSRRVAEYARQIARVAGEAFEDQRFIYYMGLLHDVGKIGVSDAVINKPGELTPEEYDEIKAHTWIGSDILQSIEEFPQFSQGARSHHEHYDGTGYPDGLKGEEIPAPARIIAVADAYDAMTSKRSYRDAMPQDAVRAEIEKGRGTQFDPHFANIMLSMIDADERFLMRESPTMTQPRK